MTILRTGHRRGLFLPRTASGTRYALLRRTGLITVHNGRQPYEDALEDGHVRQWQFDRRNFDHFWAICIEALALNAQHDPILKVLATQGFNAVAYAARRPNLDLQREAGVWVARNTSTPERPDPEDPDSPFHHLRHQLRGKRPALPHREAGRGDSPLSALVNLAYYTVRFQPADRLVILADELVRTREKPIAVGV